MMSYSELIALRARLIIAQANRHTIGAAEAYVRALEAEVALTEWNSRRATTKHLLALVDAAFEARHKLPRQINVKRDFHHRIDAAPEAQPVAPLPPAEEPAEPLVTAEPPTAEVPKVEVVKKAAPKGRRVTHGRARKVVAPTE